ncbi:MAG: allantoicase [Xanthomonadales bacterium]|jgi:allantoicase|nr:allantoicase [Xanthomonadales bacterium]
MGMVELDPEAPAFTRRHVNLADARLGARALSASDEFFAAKERMLEPATALFHPGRYDEHGKWMDGWETRRRRGAGHDWCVVRLARAGTIKGLDIDTSHFTGNFPPAASVEACALDAGDPDASTAWFPLLPTRSLRGNSHHYFEVGDARRVSHLRLNLFPDGGVARLRVYGRPDFGQAERAADGCVDLAAALNGATVVAANNEHFGPAATLLLPGRGVNMGDGWETRRRREPGHDWCVIALAQAGVIERIEVDTAHFKGNFPDRCSLHAAMSTDGSTEALVTQAMFWPLILPESALQADHVHHFSSASTAAVSHVRFNMIPDGGVSRLRLWGRPL